MSKRSVTYLLLILAAVALAIPKIFCNKSGSKAFGSKQNKPINITVFVAKQQAFASNIQVTGTLLAANEVNISPEITGRVTAVNFKEGAKVSQGQLLVQLNNKDLLAQLKKAQAQKMLKQLMFERNQALVKKGAISAEEFNTSETELASINADIDLLQEQIAKTNIKAPFSGTIGLTNISVGSIVNAGTTITGLQQTDKLKVEFSLPEKYISQVNIGQKVLFKPAGFTEYFEAIIYAIEPKVDEQTRNITARAWYTNKNNLVAGGFASVKLNLLSNNNAIAVPTQSIVPILKGQKVYVVQADSIIEKQVETGFRTDEVVEITGGLNSGDTVVVGGIMYMRSGTKVKITEVINK